MLLAVVSSAIQGAIYSGCANFSIQSLNLFIPTSNSSSSFFFIVRLIVSHVAFLELSHICFFHSIFNPGFPGLTIYVIASKQTCQCQEQ